MLSNGIECITGSHASRLTCYRVVKLIGHAPPQRIIAARPGSLKRAAMQAELRIERPVKRRAIDLGSEIPFKCVPELI